MSQPVKCAVLLSGSGRTLANFFEKIDSGTLPLHVVAVVSSRANVRGIEIARERSIPANVFVRRNFSNIETHNEAINNWLSPFGAELIILAGYLCFYLKPDGFCGPVVNIHPALLPKYGGQGFYGNKVHQAVIDADETISGCTVHLVDGQYDTGRILEQQTVPVREDDTADILAARVFEAECQLYPKVLANLVQEIRQT